MSAAREKLIVALDVDNIDQAKALVSTLGKNVSIYKVGSQLFTAYGPDVIRFLNEQGKKVFLDLKFHDIPNTVASAVRTATCHNIFMCTVHTLGGEEMLKSAVQAARDESQKKGLPRPLVVGITVLTSDAGGDHVADLVLERARLAKQCGLDGVVASSQEAALIRRELGADFVIVTPGIRPKGDQVADQKRVTTPAEAIENGSSFLVVGRPIVKAANPSMAAENILKEMEMAGCR